MEEPRPARGPDAGGLHGAYQQILYETARVLAEAPTLVDAAPRMLRAVCEGLGWQYGALWEVDRARNVLQCVGMWQPASLSFDEFAIASFLAGTQQTWPVYLFAQLRVPSLLPQLIAVSSVVFIASMLLVLSAEIGRRLAERRYGSEYTARGLG